MRKIFCTGCNKYLGEIRDAKLLKGIKFLCPKCELKRIASDIHRETNRNYTANDILGGFPWATSA